jgi:hypothetical protein
MKRTVVLLRFCLAVVFCFGIFGGVNPASAAGDRHDRECHRRCNEEFHRLKQECRGLRGRERHRCEERAKREHNECKRRCR